MQVIKIYVISLKRTSERRKLMEAQLSSFGLEAEFVDAVDGTELSEETIKLNTTNQGMEFNNTPKMTRTEIGCAWSHRNVYERLIENGEQYAVVLEDDAIISAEMVRFLGVIPKIPFDWELISLYWGFRPLPYIFQEKFPLNLYQRNKLELPPPFHRYRRGEFLLPPYGAVAYVISRAGAIRLTRCNTPIADLSDRMFCSIPRGKWIGIEPKMVYHNRVVDRTIIRSPGTIVGKSERWVLGYRFDKCASFRLFKLDYHGADGRTRRLRRAMARVVMTMLYLITGLRTRVENGKDE